MSIFRTITGTQSKAADRYAIDVMGIPSLTLMENASRCAAQEIIDRFPTDSRVLICSGTGNNGADGICMGWILYDAGFRDIHAVICGRPEKTTWEFDHQMQEYEKRGLTVSWFAEGDRLADHMVRSEAESAAESRDDQAAPDVIVDGIFGIGLHREVQGRFRSLIEQINDAGSHVICIDLPSGVDSDTGAIMGAAVQGSVTVTFGCSKAGIDIEPGNICAGEIKIVDIDIPEEAYVHAVSNNI